MRIRICFGLLLVLCLGYVSASALFSNPQYIQPNFNTYYSGSSGAGGSYLTTSWPILDSTTQCRARQDFLVQVAPVGCQPAVVRSDLLAEQNVPVFCQLSMLQVNPLLSVNEIKGIHFTGSYPKEVSGVGFHPARAALRTRDQLLGDPLVNNIGYVVIVLKKQPKESELPAKVNLTLSASIKYASANVIGVGKADFYLPEQSEQEWNTIREQGQQSFFNGKYSARLEQADDMKASIAFYQGERKIGSTSVQKGQRSSDVYLPGSYCQGALQAEYLGFESGQERALLEVSGKDGTDRIDAFERTSFNENRCRVERLQVDNSTKLTGTVVVSCGGKRATLSLLSNVGAFDVFNATGLSLVPTQDSEGLYGISYGAGSEFMNGTFRLNGKGQLEWESAGAWKTIQGTGNAGAFYDKLKNALQFYGQQKATGKEPQALREPIYSIDIERNFTETIDAYKRVATQYPAEKGTDLTGVSGYGEQALEAGVALATTLGKEATQVALLQELIRLYPTSNALSTWRTELERLSSFDSSQSTATFLVGNEYVAVKLIGFQRPQVMPHVTLSYDGRPKTLHVGENITEGRDKDMTYMRLTSLTADRATFSTNCAYSIVEPTGRYDARVGGRPFILTEGGDGTVCGKAFVLRTIETEKLAHIRLIPRAEQTETKTNISVTLGIEKRAIHLTPEQTKQKIADLNASIKKWENLNKHLETAVTSMKAACFATSGVLLLKNFFAGVAGKGFSRQKVMRGEHGWDIRCKQESEKEGISLDACFTKYAPEIEADVVKADKAVQQVNMRIKECEKSAMTSNGLLGSQIQTEKAAECYRQQLIKDEYYGTRLVSVGNGQNKTVKDLLSSQSGYKDAEYSYQQLRDLEYNLLMENQGSEQLQGNARDGLTGFGTSVLANQKQNEEIARSKLAAQNGDVVATRVSADAALPRTVQVLKGDSGKGITYSEAFDHPYDAYTQVSASPTISKQTKKSYDGVYKLALKNEGAGVYSLQDVMKPDGTTLSDTERADFAQLYNLGSVRSDDIGNLDANAWKPVSDVQVRYYETEPYKGLPALVPVDPKRGWYAATKQTLPVFGGLAGWESSGKVASFMLCNVGANGRPQVFEGLGDDSCTLINLQSRQSYEKINGVSETRAQQLVKDAIDALQEAARQHSQTSVQLKSGSYKTGKPAVNIPGVECQHFMSPSECNLLFNVCDPVICPASRCNFGGKYPVQDVIQSGIIGSTLLCLPNFPDVKIPVCLSGIHAGVDAYTSILKAHAQCLDESLKSGQMLGICDQIYSIYSCEFFWRQLSPLASIVIPKVFESAYGQNTKGGGEYLTVQAGWQNTKQSLDYFTNVYGVNAFKAFQARSVEEVGSPVCKNFISAKFPSSFKSLIQADSPVQFNAYFNSIRFSDATVPATAQYSVYYHIYAGKDQGVSYRVYLKNPPQTSYYMSQPTIQVASGFIGKGQSKDEKKDFTAPEGYSQLCVVVNNEEKCGFKQVSTSFAVNYVRDLAVADQIKDRNINSQEQCVSGSVNAAALLNPNLQQIGEEAAQPDIYRRGIIRICASANPGATTDPSRFVDVGNCGDEKLRCWLDEQSVQNAITDNNKGVKNATYQALQNMTLANLARDGSVLNQQDGQVALQGLEGVLALLRASGQPLSSDLYNRATLLVSEATQAEQTVFFNHQKARAALLIGNARAVLLQYYHALQVREQNANAETKTGSLLLRYDETSQKWEVRTQSGTSWFPLSDFLNDDSITSSQQQLLSSIQASSIRDEAVNILEQASILPESQGWWVIPAGEDKDDSSTIPESLRTQSGAVTQSSSGSQVSSPASTVSSTSKATNQVATEYSQSETDFSSTGWALAGLSGTGKTIAALCGVTHVPFAESALGAGSSLVADLKAVDTYITVLVEEGSSIYRAGSLTGNVVTIAGKSFVKSLSGEIVGTISTSGRVMRLSSSLAQQVLSAGFSIASGSRGTGIISSLTLESGANLVTASGKTVGKFGEAFQLIRMPSGILKIVQKASPWFTVLGYVGNVAIVYDMLCTGYKTEAAYFDWRVADLQAQQASDNLDFMYLDLSKKLASNIITLDDTLKELEQQAQTYKGYDEFADKQALLEQVGQLRPLLEQMRTEARSFNGLVTSYYDNQELSAQGGKISEKEATELWNTYKPLRTYLITFSSTLTSITDTLRVAIGGGEVSGEIVPASLSVIPSSSKPVFFLERTLSAQGGTNALVDPKTRSSTGFYIAYEPQTLTDAQGLAYTQEYVIKRSLPWYRKDLSVGTVTVASTSDEGIIYQLNFDFGLFANVLSKVPSGEKESAVKYANQLRADTHTVYVQDTKVYVNDL